MYAYMFLGLCRVYLVCIRCATAARRCFSLQDAHTHKLLSDIAKFDSTIAAATACMRACMHACMHTCVNESTGWYALTGELSQFAHCAFVQGTPTTIWKPSYCHARGAPAITTDSCSAFHSSIEMSFSVIGWCSVHHEDVRRLTSMIWKPHSPTKNSLRMSRCNNSRLSALWILDATAVHRAQI